MYSIVDLETSIYRSQKRKANPFDERNSVIAYGRLDEGCEPEISYSKKGLHDYDFTGIKYLVGFNFKFDMHYMWKSPKFKKWLLDGGQIWDCQYAEYLINGMQESEKMLSLDDTALRYDGVLKNDEIKALWEAGVQTVDIDKDLLINYLIGDLENTEKIFLGQLEMAGEQDQLKMLKMQMNGLLCTTEMEYNGVFIDKELGYEQAAKLEETINRYKVDLDSHLGTLPFEFNWGSNVQLSALIFGGDVKYQKRIHLTDDDGEPLYCQKTIKVDTGIIIKSGIKKGQKKYKNETVPDLDKPKMKWTDFYHTFPRMVKPRPHFKTKGGAWGTGADVLEELSVISNIPFIQTFTKYTKMQKDLTTYYISGDKGMLTLLNEKNDVIHHKLNHVNTSTSRLSSSDPNMQNIPKAKKSDVRKLFKSRFGKDGLMMEVDYSQLEVVVLGVLSRDPQLLADLNAGVDFHCKRLAKKLKRPYEEIWHEHHVLGLPEIDEQRTKIKIFSFQLAYGAGATTIAAETGMSIEEVKDLMKIEDELYPNVMQFHYKVKDSMEFTYITTDYKIFSYNNQMGYQRNGFWQSPTGTIFSASTWPNAEWLAKKGEPFGYKLTQIKNFPTQGTAGEFVKAMIGILWRECFLSTNNYDGKALLVNTVHDSVWIDLHKSVLERVARDVKVLEEVPSVFNAAFPELNITVPFPTETEIGKNLFELKKLEGTN